MVKNKKIEDITLCGGHLCLDFINTVKDRVTDPLPDYLDNFDDLLYWARRLGIIEPSHYRALQQAAHKSPQHAAAFFKESIVFREIFYKLLHGFTMTGKADSRLLETYNRALAAILPFKKIRYTDQRLAATWTFAPADFRHLLAPVIEDSYELLLEEAKLKKIKECPKCGWLFLDTTKNGMRRWCTMKTCGSSVKALEWYHRNKN